MLYDAIVASAILFVAAGLVVIPLEMSPEHPLYPLFQAYLGGVAFMFLGYFWTRGGQTIGMRTWKIRLEDFSGNPIDWRRAALRYVATLAFWIPAAYALPRFSAGSTATGAILALPLICDYLWIVFNDRRLALHDIISGTRLVRADDTS